jgi:hypothetical protein
MKRPPEAVMTKMTELFAVIQTAADDLKLAGAEANLLGDFARVQSLNDECRKLQSFEAEIKVSLDRFGAHHHSRPGPHTKHHRNTQRTRKAGGRLRVKLGGQVIEEATIAETFVKTLRLFGLERVAKLNKVLSSIPLLARNPANGYQAQRPCDGWYVTTHVNKHNASALLREIGKELNIPIQVESIDP